MAWTAFERGRCYFSLFFARLVALRLEGASLRADLGGFVTFPLDELLELFSVPGQRCSSRCLFVVALFSLPGVLFGMLSKKLQVVSGKLPLGSAEALAFRVLVDEFYAHRKGAVPWDVLVDARVELQTLYCALSIPSSMTSRTALLVNRLSSALRNTWGDLHCWPPPLTTEEWKLWFDSLGHFQAGFERMLMVAYVSKPGSCVCALA